MYRIEYSETSRNQIRTLDPFIKPIIKRRIEELKDNPFLGKQLERQLAGYYSYKARRFRIIYKIVPHAMTLQIHYVGHRKDIYELVAELISSGANA